MFIYSRHVFFYFLFMGRFFSRPHLFQLLGTSAVPGRERESPVNQIASVYLTLALPSGVSIQRDTHKKRPRLVFFQK